MDKEMIEEATKLYWGHGLTLRQIAKRFGCDDETLRYHFKRHGIPRRTKSDAIRGIRHPMWGKKHSEQTKQKIRDARKKQTISHSKETKGKLRDKKMGVQNPQWKGGKYITSEGYVFVKNYIHPRRNPKNYVHEHLLIAESVLDKCLPRQAVVHHFNEIKTDNRLGNLIICQDENYHRLLHKRARERRILT